MNLCKRFAVLFSIFAVGVIHTADPADEHDMVTAKELTMNLVVTINKK